MGERKVLNRYVPPDFDPSILPKFKREKDKKIEVRMMLPFSMRCNTCGEYMYMGKKFNSKSEIVKGDDYMGIRKFRFYIKCCVCSAEITFKTDPKNSGYECESGASRNFEMWRDTETATEEAKLEREKEDEQDAMKALENRTLDSKIEMDVLDALDEIKSINQRHERIDTNKLITSLYRDKEAAEADSKLLVNRATGLSAADEELIKSIKFKSSRPLAASTGSSGVASEGTVVEETQLGGSDSASSAHSAGQSTTNDFFSQINKQIKQQQAATASSSTGTTIIKKRKIDSAIAATEKAAVSVEPVTPAAQPAAAPSGLGGLLMGYGDSDNDSS